MIISIEYDSSYFFDIVGESHYQNALNRICGGKTEESQEFETIARIILDDENRYDPKAVRVEIDEMCVGHFSRDDARSYRRILSQIGFRDRRITVECSALIVGGWKRGDSEGHFGVKLDIPPVYGRGCENEWRDVLNDGKRYFTSPKPVEMVTLDFGDLARDSGYLNRFATAFFAVGKWMLELIGVATQRVIAGAEWFVRRGWSFEWKVTFATAFFALLLLFAIAIHRALR